MPLIHRFSRLFTADLNAVLDRIEEPDILLRQAVRDMESALASLRESARTATADAERAADAGAVAARQIAAFDDELDLCFSAGEDNLARALVRRKIEADKRRQHAQDRETAARKAVAGFNANIASSEDKLAAMRDKLALLVDEAAPVCGAEVPDPLISSDEIEVAFLREKQRRVRS